MSSKTSGFVKSIFFKAVLVLIIAGMALWGATTGVASVRTLFSGTGSNVFVAKDRQVTPTDLARRVETFVSNYNRDADTPITKQQALAEGQVDEVIQLLRVQTASLGYAYDAGISPSADAIVERLKTYDAFRNPLTGEIDPQTYETVLQQNRITKDEFQQQIADDLTISMLEKGALAGLQSPKLLADIQARYLAETRDVEWFVADTSSVPTPEAPTVEEIRAFYDENVDRLAQPERRSIDMVKMSADDFLGEVTVTEQEIATIYEATKSERFSEPDERTFVVLTFSNKQAANQAVGQLASGIDASEIANTINSETVTSKADDIADEVLRDAMFGPGKQSGSIFGPREMPGNEWQVARLVSIKPGAAIDLEFVADIIRDDLARERATAIYEQRIESIESAVAAGYSVTDVANEVGVPVMSFEPVDKSGASEDGRMYPELVVASEALDEAFFIPAGELTNSLMTENAIYVLSPHEIVDAYTPDFEAVKDRVASALVAQREQGAIGSWIAEIEERINSGASSLEAEASKLGAPLEGLRSPVSRITAETSNLPQGLFNAVFQSDEGAVLSLPSRMGDRYLIAQVKSVDQPDAADLESLTALSNESIAMSLEEDLKTVLIGELLQASELKVNEAAIQVYKASLDDQP